MFSSIELIIKDGYKLEFGNTKLIDKTKNRENVPSLEVVEVVLVECNLVDNINKSPKYYTLLIQINFPLIC